MVDAEQAKDLVLRRSEEACEGRERFAVQSCTLSRRGDYWIVRVNSEDFVVRGIQERCYVGVNAHLVNTVSGEIETVGSGQGVDQYLEDKYDAVKAGADHYVLVPDFDRNDKFAVIRLRQKLECSLQTALQLVSPEYECWLTGKRSTLSHARAMLQQQGIGTSIQLVESPGRAQAIDDSVWHWNTLKSVLNRFNAE